MENCKHCSTPLLVSLRGFCCLGCKIAYSLIQSLNLEQYYAFCKDIYQITPDKIEPLDNTINYLEFITSSNMTHTIKLMIDGIKCGSCVWLIESSLNQQNGVLQASINMMNKTLSLTWTGNIDALNDFICLIEKLGYRAMPLIESTVIESQKQTEKQLLKMLALAGFIWVQNMMISMGIWFGALEIGINSKIFMNLCATVITVPGVIYSSKIFFSAAIQALKIRQSHMDIPISIAIIVTLLISVYGTIIGSNFVFYEAVSSLVFALLIGRYLDIKVRNKANENARNLILQRVQFVTVDRDNKLQIVHVNTVKVGEKIHVAVGERIPLDGIAENITKVDNSIITGESLPQSIKIGDQIFAGAINLQYPIKVKVENEENNTILADIKRLIDQNQQSKYKTLAAKIAQVYTPVVLILSLLTIVIWLLLGENMSQSILYGVSVLVITCPCAIGLAVPIVHTITVSKLMKKGIFIKKSDALEKLTEINTIALDKTGVLTYGKPYLLNIDEIPKEFRKSLRAIATQSKHHLCRAILAALSDTNSDEICNVIEEPGYGIKCRYNGHNLLLGRAKWCGIQSDNNDLIGVLSTWFVIKDVFTLQLRFGDKIRSEAKTFIKEIQKDFTVLIISGDSKSNVKDVAKQLKIDEWYGELTPQDKNDIVKSYSNLLMIGDGLNDAPAMTAAHCSASPSNIIELSQNQSSIVFQSSLLDILTTIKAAKKANQICHMNIIIALIYNIISIPIAFLGYASPAMAALFMGISSLFVIINTTLFI